MLQDMLVKRVLNFRPHCIGLIDRSKKCMSDLMLVLSVYLDRYNADDTNGSDIMTME